MKFNLQNVIIFSVCFKIFFFILTLIIFIQTPIPQTRGNYYTNPVDNSYYSWDGSNYVNICKNGYPVNASKYADQIKLFAFLPGLPVLNCGARNVIGVLTGSSSENTLMKGPILFNAILFVILNVIVKFYLDVYFKNKYKLEKSTGFKLDGLKWFLLITLSIFPYSFYVHLNYTESVVLPLLILTMLLIKLKEFRYLAWSGLFLGFFSFATIPAGIVYYLNIILTKHNFNFLKSENHTKSEKFHKILKIVRMSFYFIPFIFGTVITSLVFWYKYGNANLFLESQAASYGRRPKPNFITDTISYLIGEKKLYFDPNFYPNGWGQIIAETGYKFYTTEFFYVITILFPFLFMGFALTLLGLKKRWLEFSLSITLWVLPLVFDVLSANRFILQSFPAIFIVSEYFYQNKITRYSLAAFYSVLFIVLFALQSHNFWVG